MHAKWVECGFDPDAFWHQTPLSFQTALRGVRARREHESKAATALAWQFAVFNGIRQSKQGLKPLDHYLREERRRQSTEEMRANLLILAQRANRMFKKESEDE